MQYFIFEDDDITKVCFLILVYICSYIKELSLVENNIDQLCDIRAKKYKDYSIYMNAL